MSEKNEREKALRAATRLVRYLAGCLCCELWTWNPDLIEKLTSRICTALRSYNEEIAVRRRHAASVSAHKESKELGDS